VVQKTVVTSATEIGKATAIFSLYNLGCSSCSSVIKRKLKKVQGIKDIDVNFVTDTVVVDYDPTRVTVEEIRAFMEKLGFDTERQAFG